MLDWLNAVHKFVWLDNKRRLLMLTERSFKDNRRCLMCDMYACHHEMDRHFNFNRNRLPLTDCAHSLSLGEGVGTEMNTLQITERRSERFPIRKSESEGKDLPLKEPVSATESKALVKPIKIEEPKVEKSNEKESVKEIDVLNDFIRCGICDGHVYLEFIAKHQQWHVWDFPSGKTTLGTTDKGRYTPRYSPSAFANGPTVSKPISTSYTSNSTSTSTSIVKVNEEKSTGKKNKTTSSSPTPKSKAFSQYKFRPIEGMAAFSCTSKDGRFSDMTIIAWLPERIRVEGWNHIGHGYGQTKDWERLVLNVMHNVDDDYYVISSKMIRRGQWSSYDYEDVVVSDRICTQEELLSEMKRIIIYTGLSPRAFYKRFRTIFRKEVIVEIKDGKKLARTESSNAFFEKMSAKPVSDHSSRHDPDDYMCG